MKTLITAVLIATLAWLPCIAQEKDAPPPDKSTTLIAGICLATIVIVGGICIVICIKRMADRIPAPPAPPPPQQPPPKKKIPPPPGKKMAKIAALMDWYDIRDQGHQDTNNGFAVFESFGVGTLEKSTKPDSGWEKQYSVLAWVSTNGLFLSFQSNGVPVVNSYHCAAGGGWETNYLDLPLTRMDQPQEFFRITPGL